MSIKGFKDYCKAAYANKFTLSGYIAGITFTASKILFPETPAMIWPEVPLLFYAEAALISTMFGGETLIAYNKTRDDININGTIDQRHSKYTKRYCNQQGIKLAAKEANLEHLIHFEQTDYMFWCTKNISPKTIPDKEVSE
jgi:hypothetical protein